MASLECSLPFSSAEGRLGLEEAFGGVVFGVDEFDP